MGVVLNVNVNRYRGLFQLFYHHRRDRGVDGNMGMTYVTAELAEIVERMESGPKEEGMDMNEAADRLAKMFPGRLQSVTQNIVTMEDGERHTRYHLYVDGPTPHGTHADRESLDDAFADIAADREASAA